MFIHEEKTFLSSSLALYFLLFFCVTTSAELKNADAFSFKKDSYVTFENGATITSHFNALEHAYSKINAVRDPSLKRGVSGGRIIAQSRNHADDFWGRWVGNNMGGTIMINARTTQLDNFTTNNYRHTAIHEMGHAFGMKHQTGNTSSAMRQGKLSIIDYTTLDKNNLNWRY